MKSCKEVVLAMDLSMSSPGFAVLGIYEGKPMVLYNNVIKTDSKQSHGRRLISISEEIGDILSEYEDEIEYYVREKGFSRFPNVTQTLFKVVGMTDYIISYYHSDKQIMVDEIATTSVKKLVTGNGKSSKEEVAEHVFRMLQIENTDDYYTKSGKLKDDLTDALAVGLAYYIKEGLI